MKTIKIMKTTKHAVFAWKRIVPVLLAVLLLGNSLPRLQVSAAEAKGGAYGQATVDGVISPDEYPESSRITLKASDFLGLNMAFTAGVAIPEDLTIDLYVMWAEAGLSIGYTVNDSTPYHGAANTFVADQLALMIDLGSSAAGGTSLKGQTLADEVAMGGKRAPRFNSYLDADGTFMWLHQWVPAEGILNQVDGLSTLCAGKTTETGFTGEYLIPWWLLAQDMNQKLGREVFDVEAVAAGTVIGEGFELSILPLYYDYASDGSPLGQYAAVSSTWFALEPDFAGVNVTLKSKDYTGDDNTGDNKPGDDKPGTNPGDDNTGDNKPGDDNTGDNKPGNDTSEDSNAVTFYGNYGKAVIDGVISPDEYPKSSTYVLTAKNLKGLKMDFSAAKDVPDDLRIELHLMWSEAGLYVGYTVYDSTTYFGAPGSYSSDQLALMIDLGSSAKGGASLKGQALSDASSPLLGGNRAPRYNSLLDSAGTFLWLHQWVPDESNMHLVDGLAELCAGKAVEKDGKTVGFSGEYLIPWWLLAQDMNQKLGREVFDVEAVATGTVIGEGFEVNITPVYYDFDSNGAGIGQYAAVTSDWFALEPDYAGVRFVLDKTTPDAPKTGDDFPVTTAVLAVLSAAMIVTLAGKKRRERAR